MKQCCEFEGLHTCKCFQPASLSATELQCVGSCVCPCGPIKHILYYMAHWFRHSNSPLKTMGSFIGSLGWVSSMTWLNMENGLRLLVDHGVSLSVVLIIPAVRNRAPVAAGIYHQVRIRALLSSHRGSVATPWFLLSVGWGCFSSAREAPRLRRRGWLPLNDSAASDMQMESKWRKRLAGIIWRMNQNAQ